MDPLIVIVLGLLMVAAASTLSERIGIAAPLLLVLTGIGVSALPFVPTVEIEPEWILAGVLPPLLYSASASMPAIALRRDLTAIGGLSVILVVGSALALGLFFAWLIPDLGLGWGIAIGAIVSPTDAVATTIVKRLGVSRRVTAILEGESLLNDATALVILRAAIAGAGASVSLWGVAATFVWAVVAALAIGLLVGHAVLFTRARLTEPAVNTVVSFTTPFLAAIPAEHVGASGLVAAVAAGLVTGRHGVEILSPRHRLSDAQNWRMVELVLEGAIFLVMGLQVTAILDEVRDDGSGVGRAVGLAAGALVVTILVRAAFVAPLLGALRSVARRGEAIRPKVIEVQGRLDAGDYREFARRRRSPEDGPSPSTIARFQSGLRRSLATIDYYLAEPLRWREGVIVVWAGMRGAVTLAAAQTLPADTPDRSLLVLVAFLVATGSLMLQGITLPSVIARVRPAAPDPVAGIAERRRVLDLLREAAASVRIQPTGQPVAEGIEAPDDYQRRISAVIAAQRAALLAVRDDGTYDAHALDTALTNLDADQISLELRGEPLVRP